MVQQLIERKDATAAAALSSNHERETKLRHSFGFEANIRKIISCL
jgi:hypothetical protein